MSISGYDKATFDAYENMLETREHAKEQLIKVAKLLEETTICYEEAIKHINFNDKCVEEAKWRYHEEFKKLGVNNIFETIDN